MKLSLIIALSIFVYRLDAQVTRVMDGDTLSFEVLSEYEDILMLKYIERGKNHSDAVWVEYDRTPFYDRWVFEPLEGFEKYSDANFIEYHRQYGIEILAAITTYDDCGCAKNKAGNSPDMFLINFKISISDLEKFKKLYRPSMKIEIIG